MNSTEKTNTVSIDNEIEARLAALLPYLEAKADEKLPSILYDFETGLLADIKDYYMFLVLRCDTSDEARKILPRLLNYAGSEHNSGFCEGFFFALIEMLSLKFEIAGMAEEKDQIGYESFTKSFYKDLITLKLKEGNACIECGKPLVNVCERCHHKISPERLAMFGGTCGCGHHEPILGIYCIEHEPWEEMHGTPAKILMKCDLK